MKWLGGKHYLNKQLIPVLKEYRKPGQLFVEPFMGGYNVTVKMDNPRLAVDRCKYIVELAESLSLGWYPPEEVSEEEYKRIRDNKDDYFNDLVGFVGYGCTFGGKFFGGYARNSNERSTTERVFTTSVCRSSYNTAIKQGKLLKGTKFIAGDYLEIFPVDNVSLDDALIYCDPPYKGTTKYRFDFDYEKFYDWCRIYSQNNTVLISERYMPDDFIKVGTFHLKPHATSNIKSRGVCTQEYLWKLKNNLSEKI